jgi:hypothetical protein
LTINPSINPRVRRASQYEARRNSSCRCEADHRSALPTCRRKSECFGDEALPRKRQCGRALCREGNRAAWLPNDPDRGNALAHAGAAVYGLAAKALVVTLAGIEECDRDAAYGAGCGPLRVGCVIGSTRK